MWRSNLKNSADSSRQLTKQHLGRIFTGGLLALALSVAVAQTPNTVSVTVPSAPASGVQDNSQLIAPNIVRAGEMFEVRWLGGDRPLDNIGLLDTEGQQLLAQDYSFEDGPVTFTAPSEPGEYELRYRTALVGGTTESRSLTVVAVTSEAALVVTDTVLTGTTVEVVWQGPATLASRILLVSVSGDEEEIVAEQPLIGNPIRFTAPELAGRYEVRFRNEDEEVLASRAVVVLEPTAILTAPSRVVANEPFEVLWQGPARRFDYLSITPIGEPGNIDRLYRYVSAGNPLTLTAPSEPGIYEIQYRSDLPLSYFGNIYGRVLVRVTPGR